MSCLKVDANCDWLALLALIPRLVAEAVCTPAGSFCGSRWLPAQGPSAMPRSPGGTLSRLGRFLWRRSTPGALIHALGQLVQLSCRGAQGLGAILTDVGNDLVIKVANEIAHIFFDASAGFVQPFLPRTLRILICHNRHISTVHYRKVEKSRSMRQKAIPHCGAEVVTSFLQRIITPWAKQRDSQGMRLLKKASTQRARLFPRDAGTVSQFFEVFS